MYTVYKTKRNFKETISSKILKEMIVHLCALFCKPYKKKSKKTQQKNKYDIICIFTRLT